MCLMRIELSQLLTYYYLPLSYMCTFIHSFLFCVSLLFYYTHTVKYALQFGNHYSEPTICLLVVD